MLGLVFLIGEREFPKYPQIPNEIKHNKKITYLSLSIFISILSMAQIYIE